MGGRAARVRGQVHRPRPLPGMGRPGLLPAGLGAAAGGVRRRGGPGLAVAGGRRVYRQGPAGAKGGPGEAQATGANPTDRGKCGSKRHLLTEGKGLPIALVLSGANRTDMKKLADLLDAKVIEPPAPAAATDGADPAGPETQLTLDRGYDY